ncbi:hypothetical protein [uncultured Friedmanniella sp.]|uniref:hypothetical protein n=1 Tax=uncultured Friedmanniella sp. TaxID=335381 RepID=UPI0035CC92E8
MTGMSRRAKVYWGVLGLGIGVAIAGVVVGAVGVATNSHTLMGYITAAIFVEFALVGIGFLIRGGLTKPHPR